MRPFVGDPQLHSQPSTQARELGGARHAVFVIMLKVSLNAVLWFFSLIATHVQGTPFGG